MVVNVPLAKSPPWQASARALMLIGQIVSGFEEKAVINEPSVKEAGGKQPLHLPSWERRQAAAGCACPEGVAE